MDEKSVFSFYKRSVVCVQFIAESLVNLDKRNTNGGRSRKTDLRAIYKKNFFLSK